MRKAFQVLIYDRFYWVWSIDGKEHAGNNDTIPTWWCYFSTEELPEGITPPIDSPNWVPYDRDMNRTNFDITFSQHTSTKEKWGETRFRNHTRCQINCNGKPMYSFGTIGGDRGLSYAMVKAQYLITEMSEHPFNFYDPKQEHGRKIWWYGMPAKVRVWREGEPWLIGIDPDYSGVDRETWWKEYKKRHDTYIPKKNDDWAEMQEEQMQENEDDGWINWGDALSDSYIDWFRQ